MAIEVQYSSMTQLSSSDWKFSDVMVYIVPYAVMLPFLSKDWEVQIIPCRTIHKIVESLCAL